MGEAAKHVILSGGSRGLGKSLAEALLAGGYRISTFSRNPTEFTRRLEKNDNCFYSSADCEDPDSLIGFLKGAVERFGPPWGLINSAGIAVEGVLATIPDSTIDRAIDVNLKGTLRLTKLVTRKMLVNGGGGVILNISSIIGLRGYSGLAAYAASKGGMDAFTRALARELGNRNIRVNSIAPGYLATEMTHGLDDQQRRQIIRRTPLGRLGTPQDVVGAVLFLLSPAAEFITGQVLVIDGGITA